MKRVRNTVVYNFAAKRTVDMQVYVLLLHITKQKWKKKEKEWNHMQQTPLDELQSESVSVRLFPTSGRLRIHWKVSSGIFLNMEDKQNYHYFLFTITLFPFYIDVSVTTIGYVI